MIVIYHNPACKTSQNTLKIIEESGADFRIIEYLNTPPTREELTTHLSNMNISVRDLLRKNGTPYVDLNLDDPKWTDDELISKMLEHPILINRPIVITPIGTRLCRPSETVREILPE
ncbi:MAG: arsenate reductase (glutaredoxin) [Stappiaceae bacterium]